LAGSQSPAQTPEQSEFFENNIRPVLSERCYPCHTGLKSGGLRLDSRESILKGGNDGPAIVPGHPEDSLLIKVLTHTHERIKMPPADKLDDETIEHFKNWIHGGAVWPPSAPQPLSAPAEYQITPEQKSFWSFQPPRKPAVVKVKKRSWVRTPIDHFILARLEAKKLKPAPPADKRVLIRRATFDLTGLPPTPEEVEAFLADRSRKAFVKVLDRLLASPHYGERWGRHWLDVVRYADSAGDSADYPVPQAYLYRNYVIDAFNRDKPYDQFIREQIAGDLLLAASEPDHWERTIATGYLGIAKRFSVKPENYKYLTIDDTIDNLGKTLLGLSIACARCHDHKYDPISSKDYYALYGILDSTRYPFAGSENVKEQRDFVYRLPEAQVQAILKPYTDRLKPLEDRLKQLEEERKALIRAGAAADSGSLPTPAHRTVKDISQEMADIGKQRLAIGMEMPVLESAYAVAEGTSHNAQVLVRGDPKTRGDEVPRRFLQVLGGQELPRDCRASGRLQLAEWIADPKNPLTARVMVNRIWQYHFGKGIVATPSNFGRRGQPPTHPELLDYLATRFMESGWSIKAMHRLIMLSRTYQLASDGPAENARLDPANDLLWKFDRRRLDAESVRDSVLMVSGDLDLRVGAVHPFPHPMSWTFTQHKPFSAEYDTNKRSVYLMVQRSQRHPYLSIFDGADPNVSTAERTDRKSVV